MSKVKDYYIAITEELNVDSYLAPNRINHENKKMHAIKLHY